MELSRHWLMMRSMIRLLVFYGALCLLTVSSSMRSQPAALQKDPPASRQEIESFWRATLQRAAKEPLEAEVEPVKEPLPYQKFRVTYRSLGNIKIRAYLGVPIRGEGPQQKLPGIVTAPGYGGSQQGVMLEDCQRGYAVLQVYPRSQGESADLWKIDGPDKLTWRVDQPEGSYYQGAYVDVMRGIDYLLSRADIDASRVGAMGTSQGGGIVLAVAALDSRVKAVAAHVPFLCDMRRAALIPGALVKNVVGTAWGSQCPNPENAGLFRSGESGGGTSGTGASQFRGAGCGLPTRDDSVCLRSAARNQVHRGVSCIATHVVGRFLQNGLGVDGPALGTLSLQQGSGATRKV